MSGDDRPVAIGEFLHREIVHVLAQPARIHKPLVGKVGYVVGCSDFDSPETGERDYGVHINEYGETFAIPRGLLRGTGEVGQAADIVSRSRLGQRVVNRA